MKQNRRPSAERTNIVLDSKLVQRVKRLAKVKTTRDAIPDSLRARPLVVPARLPVSRTREARPEGSEASVTSACRSQLPTYITDEHSNDNAIIHLHRVCPEAVDSIAPPPCSLADQREPPCSGVRHDAAHHLAILCSLPQEYAHVPQLREDEVHALSNTLRHRSIE
jgi:hypothetical protein